MLGRRRRWWANIEPTFGHSFIINMINTAFLLSQTLLGVRVLLIYPHPCRDMSTY